MALVSNMERFVWNFHLWELWGVNFLIKIRNSLQKMVLPGGILKGIFSIIRNINYKLVSLYDCCNKKVWVKTKLNNYFFIIFDQLMFGLCRKSTLCKGYVLSKIFFPCLALIVRFGTEKLFWTKITSFIEHRKHHRKLLSFTIINKH